MGWRRTSAAAILVEECLTTKGQRCTGTGYSERSNAATFWPIGSTNHNKQQRAIGENCHVTLCGAVASTNGSVSLRSILPTSRRTSTARVPRRPSASRSVAQFHLVQQLLHFVFALGVTRLDGHGFRLVGPAIFEQQCRQDALRVGAHWAARHV